MAGRPTDQIYYVREDHQLREHTQKFTAFYLEWQLRNAGRMDRRTGVYIEYRNIRLVKVHVSLQKPDTNL